jgi:hypothetical protein
MLITPLDSTKNLFSVSDIISPELIEKVLATPWTEVEYKRQQFGPKGNYRREICNDQLPWYADWCQELKAHYNQLMLDCRVTMLPIEETAFWVDFPGYRSLLHVDEHISGSMQLYWIGKPQCGTTFFTDQYATDIKHQFEFTTNTGYIAINPPEGQWHSMTKPIPPGSIRVSSYTWLTPWDYSEHE